MKILRIILHVLLGLLLVMPAIGPLGVLPPPTPEMFTPEGWAFISALMNAGYMMPMIGLTCAVTLVLLILRKSALAAIIIAPFTVNVIAFHWFLDLTPIGPSSVLAYLLLILNAYVLWENRAKYRGLWA